MSEIFGPEGQGKNQGAAKKKQDGPKKPPTGEGEKGRQGQATDCRSLPHGKQTTPDPPRRKLRNTETCASHGPKSHFRAAVGQRVPGTENPGESLHQPLLPDFPCLAPS